jgi:endoglucanase
VTTASASQDRLWQTSGLPRLERGVNFGDFLERRCTPGEAVPAVDPAWFPLLAAAGFDFVRLPVCWSAHADAAPPYRIDESFLDGVLRLTEAALACGLAVVVDHHHYRELMDDPDSHRRRFATLWSALARRLHGLPDRVFAELLNEPMGLLTPALWNGYLREAYAAVRAEDARRPVVVCPADWSNLSGFASLSLSGLENDRRVVIDFHYYEPHVFTHQGAPWENPSPPVGRHWTGAPRDRAALAKDLDRAVAWGKKLKRPLLLGEFGVYQAHTDATEAAAWTRAVREGAEERGIAWCVWDFCGGFGIWDAGTKKFKEPLLRALIP